MKKKLTKTILFVSMIVMALALVLTSVSAVFAATEYNIQGAGPVSVTTLEGTAIFQEWTLNGSTGTGVFNPFLQVNGANDNIVKGFNTNGTLEFSTTEPTYAVTLAELPIEVVGNISYREFMLDSNQNKGGGGENQQLTWDQLKVYQTNNSLINSTQLAGLTPIWDLDSGADRYIRFDGEWGAGSGKGDMRILIPASLFSSSYTYVIAWVQFGGDATWPNNDGFEEFGYIIKPTGCLQITKSLSIPVGVLLAPLDGTFTVNVANATAGYSQDVTFTMVDGVITSTNPVTLSGLTPGNYTLTETGLPPYWVATGGLGNVTVIEGSTCATRTVTNTFQTGCLTVHKNITGIAGVLGTIPNATFTVNVSGPSFSSPQVLTFHFNGSVITDNDQTLSPLIPGNYTVSEPGVPANWNLVSILPTQPINVAAGSNCTTNNVTVTNNYNPGCLKVHKNITGIAGVLGTIPDGNFTVNVTGPSFSTP